ncbi:hypothetical protein OsI_26006 [Oryza sativa Indica Group]|uniref:Uncharacterized protein n=1 Tax=Oryza sativa subsp. indica TaxID=39946 RepID=B8B620_ORYSI|nr:hypothetical protein OsI_26006 [Oryza sativa Indica Group]
MQCDRGLGKRILGRFVLVLEGGSHGDSPVVAHGTRLKKKKKKKKKKKWLLSERWELTVVKPCGSIVDGWTLQGQADRQKRDRRGWASGQALALRAAAPPARAGGGAGWQAKELKSVR